MGKSTVHILWLGLFLGCISVLYFFSLVLHLPVAVTALLVVLTGYFSYRWVNRHINSFTSHESFSSSEIPAEGRKGFLLLAAGIAALTAAAILLARKYGDWDATTIWNFDALFLKDPQYWKALFKVEISHPDYPLLLPGNTAFFWRLLGTVSTTVPFIVSMLFYAMIPVLVYLELYAKNTWIAAIAFGVFLTNSYYLNLGLIQCADVPLGFYLLGAMVAMDRYKNSLTPAFIFLCGALLGCCIWTKNEGLVMALLFGIFYLKTILSQKNFQYFTAGLLPFALTLFVFKTFYAPANDLVRNQHLVPWQNITDISRYKIIFQFFAEQLLHHFPIPAIAVTGYIVYCIVRKQKLSKNFWLLCAIMGAYFLVYIYTPYNIEWHVSTSIGRLMVQLMPAMIYVAANHLASGRLKAMQQ